jgi:hypothetical protein
LWKRNQWGKEGKNIVQCAGRNREIPERCGGENVLTKEGAQEEMCAERKVRR